MLTKSGQWLQGRTWSAPTKGLSRNSVVFSAPFRSAEIAERELLIDNILVRIHCIIEMIRWTDLAPWKFEFPFHTLSPLQRNDKEHIAHFKKRNAHI